MFIETKTPSKVTIGFKVTPSKKLEIATTAKEMGMNVAQYLEATTFQNHDKIVELCQRPLDTNLEQEHFIKTLLNQLRKQHPNKSDAQLIIAALKLGIENDQRIVSNKLKNYL